MKRLLFPNGDIRTVYEFGDLSKELQDAEIEDIVNMLIETCTWDPEQDPEKDDWIQSACREADRMQTPWFTGSILWEKNEETIKEMPIINGWLYDEDGTLLPITTHTNKGEVVKYTYGNKETEIQIIQL